jgi:carboxyl-terminal processing protease
MPELSGTPLCSIYNDYQRSSDGEVQGVGLLLANDQGSKHVVVVAPMRNGPAERAGLRQGDQLLQIDGQRIEDMDSHSAGQLLRGKTGSSVNVQVRL